MNSNKLLEKHGYNKTVFFCYQFYPTIEKYHLLVFRRMKIVYNKIIKGGAVCGKG